MILYGTAHHVGDAITTDAIIAPGQRDDDPAALAAHCLATVAPAIAEQVDEGDVLLAGSDFGRGDAPEIAVLALQAAGFAAVICASAGAEFAEDAASYGLPVLVCPAAVAEIAAGSVVRLDLASGRVTDRTTGASYAAPPCAPALIAAVLRGQLLRSMRRVVEEEGFDG